MFNGKINYKWPFSIVTLNYQRVTYIENSSTTAAAERSLPAACLEVSFGDLPAAAKH